MTDENPTDPFKRAVASAVRSIAGNSELEVTFSPEQPALRGKKVRLPLPSRNLPPEEVAAVRGAGDAYALKLAYHEDAIDRELRPGGGDAGAIFEAAEQARVEAIGSVAMPGVKENLGTILAMRCRALGLGEAKEQIQAPLTDILGLIVRERLTGDPPPEIARRAVDLWRPFVEAKVGIALDKLKGSVRDQRAFGKLTRSILTGLELADEYVEEPDGEEQSPEGAEQQQAGGEQIRRARKARPPVSRAKRRIPMRLAKTLPEKSNPTTGIFRFTGNSRRKTSLPSRSPVFRCRALGLCRVHHAIR